MPAATKDERVEAPGAEASTDSANAEESQQPTDSSTPAATKEESVKSPGAKVSTDSANTEESQQPTEGRR
jgi:hypothetical protein